MSLPKGLYIQTSNIFETTWSMKVIPYGFPCKGKINFVLLTDINWLNGFQKFLHTAKSVKIF